MENHLVEWTVEGVAAVDIAAWWLVIALVTVVMVAKNDIPAQSMKSWASQLHGVGFHWEYSRYMSATGECRSDVCCPGDDCCALPNEYKTHHGT